MQDGLCYAFQGPDPAPPRHRSAEAFPPFRRKPVGRQDQPRSNDPDADVGREGLPQAGGQVREGELREAVRQVTGPQFAGEGVPEEEDPRVSPPLAQQRQQRSCQQERTAEIDGEDGVPRGGGNIAGRRPGKDGGIVDQQVQAPELPAQPVREPRERRRPGQVEAERRSRRSAPPAPSPPRRRRGTSGRPRSRPSRGRGRSPRRSAGSRR